MKKVIITTTGLSVVGHTGGISSYVHELASNLTYFGYDVHVFLFREDDVIIPNGIIYSLNVFKMSNKFYEEENLIRSLYKQIELYEPDILINNNVAYIAGLWRLLRREILKISVIHGFSSKKYSYDNSGIIGKLGVLNHSYVDYIVCQNSEMCTDVAKKYNIPKEKLIFIPQTSESLNKIKDRNSFTIMFSSGERIEKGSDIMLALSEKLKTTNLDFKIKWCYDAPNIEKKFFDDDRYVFFGKLSRAEFLNELSNSDCTIIPTKLDTGPMLLVEAMANNVTVVCNNLKKSAIPDLITSGENGILIDKNSIEGFFEAVKLLINNRDYCLGLSNNARVFFDKNLTKECQVRSYEKLFYNKNSFVDSELYSAKYFVLNNLKKTSEISKYSLQRIFYKIINTLELPLKNTFLIRLANKFFG